jgi:hypothetical protein
MLQYVNKCRQTSKSKLGHDSDMMTTSLRSTDLDYVSPSAKGHTDFHKYIYMLLVMNLYT